MLAIVSDLHLTDGTTSTPVRPDAFELLGREITEAAEQNGAQEVRLVLLGDIFDLVRTDWWFRSGNAPPDKRPWNGNLDPKTGMNSAVADPQTGLTEAERQYNAILTEILAHPTTKKFIKVVRKLAASKRVPKFNVTYVMGNHDRALNSFPSLQTRIEDALGVPQARGAVEFVSALIALEYGVAARHGHEWDENCNARLLLEEVLRKDKKWDCLDPEVNQWQNLGEVITAELMSGLAWRVHEHVHGGGDPVLLEVIKQVDLLRPATHVFQWIEWRARDLGDKEKSFLAGALVESLTGVVDSAYGKLWDKVATDFVVSGDLVDRLQLARSRIKKYGYDGLRECVKTLVAFSNLASAVAPAKAEDYEGARKEFEGLNPDIQYLVYGHTHRAQHNYVSCKPDGRVRLYINTGTYLPLLEATDDGRGFAESHQMTLAFFYNRDEDAGQRADDGPTLDLWNGIKRKRYKEE